MTGKVPTKADHKKPVAKVQLLNPDFRFKTNVITENAIQNGSSIEEATARFRKMGFKQVHRHTVRDSATDSVYQTIILARKNFGGLVIMTAGALKDKPATVRKITLHGCISEANMARVKPVLPTGREWSVKTKQYQHLSRPPSVLLFEVTITNISELIIPALAESQLLETVWHGVRTDPKIFTPAGITLENHKSHRINLGKNPTAEQVDRALIVMSEEHERKTPEWLQEMLCTSEYHGLRRARDTRQKKETDEKPKAPVTDLSQLVSKFNERHHVR